MTTTIADVAVDEANKPAANLPVRAHLVTSVYELAAGGNVAREAPTVYTGSDGSWSLDLVPIDDLLEPEGSYYRLTVGKRSYSITVPASGGPYSLEDDGILIVPDPLPAVGATAASVALRWRVALWDGDEYVDPGTGADFERVGSEIVAFLGGPTDPTSVDGDLWVQTE